MPTYLKPLLVLVISILLFGGAFYLADTQVMDYVRTHFYNPSIIRSIVQENQIDSEIVQNHINELQKTFSDILNEPSIKNSFLHTQTAEDIYERSRILGLLLENIGGLQAVQFIDSNGIRIHFSTSSRDIISQTSNATTYRNYSDDIRALPYDLISVRANENSKFIMDDSYDRILFSFPFYDSLDVYRGTAIFYLSVRALAERLIAEGRLKPTDDVSVIRIPPGVVFGSPDTSKPIILDKVSSIWSEGLREHITFEAEDSGEKFALISTRTSQNLFFGRIINDSVFAIPESMLLILFISMFSTFYLTVYFLINFKPNPQTLVQNRIRTLRSNLFEQLYINKEPQERAKWILELEQRRDEIRAELKHKIRVRAKLNKKLDSMIDNAWDELISIMKSAGNTIELVKAVRQKAAKFESDAHVNALEEADEIESLDEVESLDEKVDSLEEVDTLEEFTEDVSFDEADTIEEIEEIEEIDEVAPLEEVEEIEQLDEIAEEVEETEQLDEVVEEIEEIEQLDEIAEEVEETEQLDEIAEEVEEIEQFDEITEEIEETKQLDEIAKEDDTESLDEVTENKEIETADVIEDDIFIEYVETLDEIYITKKAIPQAKEEHTGLLAKAIKKQFLKGLLAKASKKKSKGLLAKASKKKPKRVESAINRARESKGLLALASKEKEIISRQQSKKGLLSLASESENKKAVLTSKGLLAIASEIEFSRDIPVQDEQEQEFTVEMEVVSPFASMFSSLNEMDS